MNTSVSYHYLKLGSKDTILFISLNKAGCIRRFHHASYSIFRQLSVVDSDK